MNWVHCQNVRIVKNGIDQAGGQRIQTYRCNECGCRFNDVIKSAFW